MRVREPAGADCGGMEVWRACAYAVLAGAWPLHVLGMPGVFRQVLVDKFCILVSAQSAKLPAAASVPPSRRPSRA